MAKVLIIDDEKQIRRILGVMLREKGHEVDEAESGEAGLETQTVFQANIALVDLSLPGIDGLETLRRLLDVTPQTDVIMMTAYGTIRSAVDAMRLGAFDYLTKPFDNEELHLIIERALRMRQLNAEIESLRSELEARYGFNELIGISRPMQEIFHVMAKVARVDATVLIVGESGTGKELVARAIHRRSQRTAGPFVAVNCGAIPQTLVEADFFGHERGAFTDARERRIGKFEQAHGGTLFLDEIGELSIEAQAKLLRALQDHQITRLGGSQPIRVDVRVMAATNKDLEQAIRQGQFREDLYWRINVVNIKLPPLRERREDLKLLIDHFLDRFNRELGVHVRSIAPDAHRLMLEYDWPGNVRELENTLCRAMILCEGDELTVSDLPPRIRGEISEGVGLPTSDLNRMKLADAVGEATERLERMMIIARLAECKGNRTATAESLGISRKTLFNKMRQYALEVEEEND